VRDEFATNQERIVPTVFTRQLHLCDHDHTMRPVLVFAALFVYVCADITVNRGESVHGWVSLVSSVVRSVTAFG
jgi:hypothetical protein